MLEHGCDAGMSSVVMHDVSTLSYIRRRRHHNYHDGTMITFFPEPSGSRIHRQTSSPAPHIAIDPH